MESSERVRTFLRNLWGEIDNSSLSHTHRDTLEQIWNLMGECGGKPPKDLVEQIYDMMMKTPEMAVVSHQKPKMLERVVASTAWVRDRLNNGERVFDLGTNTGHQILFWASELPGSHFIGIDVSDNVLNIAKQWIKALDLGNVEVWQDDLMAPKPHVTPSSLDVIVNCFAIETVPEFLAESCSLPDWVFESLKPEGRLIAVLTVDSWEDLAAIIGKWRSQGLNLIEIDMLDTGDGSCHPALVMSSSEEDNKISEEDIITWAAQESHSIYESYCHGNELEQIRAEFL